MSCTHTQMCTCTDRELVPHPHHGLVVTQRGLLRGAAGDEEGSRNSEKGVRICPKASGNGPDLDPEPPCDPPTRRLFEKTTEIAHKLPRAQDALMNGERRRENRAFGEAPVNPSGSLGSPLPPSPSEPPALPPSSEFLPRPLVGSSRLGRRPGRPQAAVGCGWWWGRWCVGHAADPALASSWVISSPVPVAPASPGISKPTESSRPLLFP